MNKILQGSVAGVAGVTLLAGGFGTFALWQDEAKYDGGDVDSGVLEIVSVGNAQNPAEWTDISPDVTDKGWDPANDVMVPGDVVQLKQPLEVDTTGKNLTAKLTVLGHTETFDQLVVEVEYGDQIARSSNEGGLPDEQGERSLELTYQGEAAIKALDDASHVFVRFTFPKGVTGTADQGETIDLSDVTFRLEQIRPS